MVWVVLWVLGLAAFIAGAFLQQALSAYRGFDRAVEIAAAIGWVILVLAAIVLVANLAAMAFYTIRRGTRDRQEGKVVTVHQTLGVSPSVPFPAGISKLKMLHSSHAHVSMESLVRGTAAPGDRMMVLGIIASLVAFFLIFVGAGLMLSKESLVAAVFFPTVPGLWLYRSLRDMWRHYQVAKKRA